MGVKMGAVDLLANFTGAFTATGKIMGKWRLHYAAQGQAILDAVPDAESISEAVYRLRTESARPTCLTCGNRVRFSFADGAYQRFCSSRCGQLHSTVKQAKVKTNLERHGVPNAGGFGTEVHKSAMLEKYGVEHPMDSFEIRQRVVDTNLERYGVTNVFAAEEIKEKIKDTVIERYGVEHVMQVPSVKAKYRNEKGEWKAFGTNIELRLQHRLQTITRTVQERLDEHGFELLFEPTGFGYDQRHTVKHHTCGTVFSTALYSGHIPRCFTCEPKLHGTSKLQISVQEFISSLGIEIEVGNRKILGGKEIDIYIPSHGLGFEINGLYAHSELAYKHSGRMNKQASTQHLHKTQIAESKGIRLVHLFEDDIRDRWTVVQSMICSMLQLNGRIFARRCVVREVPANEARAFCDDNHLRRSARFTFAVGAYHRDELVACAVFGPPRYAKKHDFELIRFCTKLNITVVGALSRIIKFFENKKRPVSLLSYADRSYSNGNAYLKCGFTLERTTSPNYWYFKDNECIRQHPTQLRKYKLKRLYSDLDMSKTEWELLRERGWNRIWDCGQLVFTKTSK